MLEERFEKEINLHHGGKRSKLRGSPQNKEEGEGKKDLL